MRRYPVVDSMDKEYDIIYDSKRKDIYEVERQVVK